MIDKRTIFEIHRLKHLGWSERKIARHLRIDRGSVKKYARTPEVVQKRPNRTSKLDPYRDQIKALLDEDPLSVPRSYCSSWKALPAKSPSSAIICAN
jgi:transposase